MTGSSGSGYGTGTRAPTWPFVLSLATVTTSAGLLFLIRNTADPLPKNMAGWICGAVLPVLFLVIYQHRDRHLRTRRDFIASAYGKTRIAVVTLLGLSVGAVHGYYIAGWLAS